VLAALATHVAVLGLAVVLVGVASSVYFLARQSYLTEVTPPLKRARVLSTLGGVHRIGQFIGPFAGAALIALGGLPWAYWMAAVAAALSVAVVLAAGADGAAASSRGAPVPLRQVAREHAHVFATLGIAVLLIGAVRGATADGAAALGGSTWASIRPRPRWCSGCRRGGHAALLPGREDHGPLRAALDRHTLDARDGGPRSWRCRSPPRSVRSPWWRRPSGSATASPPASS
jgi:MFS family permease